MSWRLIWQREGEMVSYRLYTIDGAGKIVGAEWLLAQSDSDAIGLVRAHKKGGKCEIWNRSKLIRTIDA
jgi:hypothetical protein